MTIHRISPCAVIDTQSVLDWQFFANPVCGDWLAGLQAGAWGWIATPAMRDELAHVLGRGIRGRWSTPTAQVLAVFDQWAEILPVPVVPWGGWPRCRDPDDQKFIDLALTCGARWLVSRDKAVLKLARHCRERSGLTVVPPEQWHPPSPG